MNQSIVWKIVLTAAVLAFAITSFIPPNDTPFKEYILEAASAQQEEFRGIINQAEELMAEDSDKYPTLFVTLEKMVAEQGLDLAPVNRDYGDVEQGGYFPHIYVADIGNRQDRNEILLAELLKRSQGEINLGLDLSGGVAVTFRVAEEDLAENPYQRQEDLTKARAIILERVDALGVAEPIVRLKGERAIEVQMPGVSTRDNPAILDTIGKPAVLEFSVVHRTANPLTQPDPPPGYVKKILEREDRTGDVQEVPYYVKAIPEATGEIIDQAFATPTGFGGYEIILDMTEDGAEQFARITRRIAEENERMGGGQPGQLAIILDGVLYSAPTVREEIRGGRASITGQFRQREALELANVLNNPLEVGLEVDEMYEVGPSLAEDSRDASLMAGAVGGGLVILFMLAYYGLGGFVAVLAVLANVTIVIGVLASFNATITLPGVAALVLTIGMAVDANILIFERMREELKAGKSLHSSMIAGFDKALSTIVDANVTTFITAAILFWLGTGPVKGFGLTLMIGIGATLFCSLIVFRWLMELLVNVGLIRRMSKWQFFDRTTFNFLNYSRRAFAAGWTLVFIGVIATVFHWDEIFGIDFVGGDEVTVSYVERVSPQDIEQVADEADFDEVNAIYQNLVGQDVEVITIQTETGQGTDFYAALTQAFPDAGLELIGETRIGAAVGDEVTRSAIISMVAALLAILFYIAVRFEFGYGIGAVVATCHDVLMTIGLFVALGEFLNIGSGQFTAPMIAAILMTVGYSINDTIVVFDRIREELDLNPGMHLRKVVHMAINRVLNRTILTSVTTLLATFALYLLGAGVIVDFALVFMIGILTGTFSSVFIASPVFYWYHRGDRRKVEEHHILPSYDWSTEEKPAKPSKAEA